MQGFAIGAGPLFPVRENALMALFQALAPGPLFLRFPAKKTRQAEAALAVSGGFDRGEKVGLQLCRDSFLAGLAQGCKALDDRIEMRRYIAVEYARHHLAKIYAEVFIF